MKLKELQDIICTDLVILDHDTGVKYFDVCKTGSLFEGFADYEVIGIRTYLKSVIQNYLFIDVKKGN